MHVLVTADTIGGVWIYTRELVTGLARRGIRVTLVSFGEIPTAAQSESQLRSLYSRAAIYAATSRYEPFGLAPLEAAFSRCAVVANDIPTFRELWGPTACYFRRNDASSLAETVARLRADRELRLTFATLALNRARQCFTASRMVDEYLALYNSMITAGVAAA